MSIYRKHASINPKATFYLGNGTGRDGYILSNSGGFYKNTNLPKITHATGGFGQASPKIKDVKPRLDAKSLHYHSDGSGRDKYILFDEGGFARSSERSKDYYWNTLRSYDKIKSPTSNTSGAFDYFAWAQQAQPQTTTELAKSQSMKMLISRISSPRKVTLKKGAQLTTSSKGFKLQPQSPTRPNPAKLFN